MSTVKRVLWVEDNPHIAAGNMFLQDEMHNVTTMEEAIREFSSERLYMYDTIVLDINFADNLGNPEIVIPKLRERLYLSKDQSNNDFIEDNGGYLLYLFLLERGYPSDQIAFLTGNAGMINQLIEFNKKCIAEMSKEDVANAIYEAWEKADNKYEPFYNEVHHLPVDARYKDDTFLEQFFTEPGLNLELAKNLVNEVQIGTPIDTLENTGDKIIFRFHDANLKSPNYFSKVANKIEGHNPEDAISWMNELRTKEHLCRWLVLDAGYFVEKCFRNDQIRMESQIQDILYDIHEDGGIRSAFRQMYFVFDGLRAVEHLGVYYQAISVALIPFEAKPISSGDYINTGFSDKKMRRMFARCLKNARNYCAHNLMGTTISIEAMLFLLMIYMTAIMERNQREEKNSWYEKAASLLSDKFRDCDYDISELNDKVDILANELWTAGTIEVEDWSAAEIPSPLSILYAMGYNEHIKSSEIHAAIREDYYMFALSAYIVKWFNGNSPETVNEKYGLAVAWLYKIALKIVKAYEYPH